MSDFLTRLVGRTVDGLSPVRPRLPSRFENGLQVQPVVEEAARVETAPPPRHTAPRSAPADHPQVEAPPHRPGVPVGVQAESIRPRTTESVPVERHEHKPIPTAEPIVVVKPHIPSGIRHVTPTADRGESQSGPQPSAEHPSLAQPALPYAPVTPHAPLAAPLRSDPAQSTEPTVRALVQKMRLPVPPGPQQGPPARTADAVRPPAPPTPPTPKPEINVTIGRIEVRAVAPAPPLPVKPAPTPKLTLDSYLRSFPRGRV